MMFIFPQERKEGRGRNTCGKLFFGPAGEMFSGKKDILCGCLHLIGSVKSSVVQRSLLVVVPDVDVEGVRLEEALDHLGRALQLALK